MNMMFKRRSSPASRVGRSPQALVLGAVGALAIVVSSVGISQAVTTVGVPPTAPSQPTAADVRAATTGVDSAAHGDLLPCTGDQQPANFAIYSLGPSADGLQLSSESRDCETYAKGSLGRANYVSYVYGSCSIPDGAERCEPPLEIQTWPACERNLAMYESEPGTPYPNTYLGTIRNAPAYSFNGGTRIEIYSADSTIVVFATDPATAMSATAQLQPESSAAPPPAQPQRSAVAATLAAPEAGSLDGTLSCQ